MAAWTERTEPTTAWLDYRIDTLLKEDGFNLLLENGENILLESSFDETTSWTERTEPSTSWA